MSKLFESLRGPKMQSNLPLESVYKYKTRFSMLGTTGSGKSTIAAFLVLTSQTLSSRFEHFFCLPVEGSSRILEDASNLRQGRFPAKTQAYQPFAYESGLLLKWAGTFRDRKVQIPISDYAGEDLSFMMRPKSLSTPSPENYGAAMALCNYVLDSDGFILVVPASRALMFHRELQIEPEPSDLALDPDVNLARILGAVVSYKEQSRARKIKGIAVVITKWDLIAPYAMRYGYDISTHQGMEHFMRVCFPATAQALKFYGLDKVQFFPSAVALEYDGDGNKKSWPSGGYMIETDSRTRVPKYWEQTYVNLFEYLKSFAT